MRERGDRNRFCYRFNCNDRKRKENDKKHNSKKKIRNENCKSENKSLRKSMQRTERK